MTPQFELIYAQTTNGVIGVDGKLPWSNQVDDIKHFKKITTGGVVIMGKNTFESLNRKPLSGRINVVVSKTLSHSEDVLIFESLNEVVDSLPVMNDMFIIGGEKVYTQALKMGIVKRIHRTIIYTKVEGDIYAPEIPTDFEMVSTTKHESNDRNTHPYEFQVWEIKK